MKLQRELHAVKLLIVDELGYVPLSPAGAELLFEVLSQRYERGSTIITSNLTFEDWTSVLGSERLIGALLDRLTHHVHILAMNGDSYRLKQSARRRQAAAMVLTGRSKTRPPPKQTISPTPPKSPPRHRPSLNRLPKSHRPLARYGAIEKRASRAASVAPELACFYSAAVAWN